METQANPTSNTYTKRIAVLVVMVIAALMAITPSADARGNDQRTIKDAPEYQAVTICIIDGANHCFDEFKLPPVPCLPFQKVCATPPETAAPSTDLGFAGIQTSTADAPFGSCVGVSACNDFAVECAEGGGYVDPDTTNDDGQTTAGTCVNDD